MADCLSVLNPSKPPAPGFALTRLTDGSCGIPLPVQVAQCVSQLHFFIPVKIGLFYRQASFF